MPGNDVTARYVHCVSVVDLRMFAANENFLTTLFLNPKYNTRHLKTK